jgi:hypothetical protein
VIPGPVPTNLPRVARFSLGVALCVPFSLIALLVLPRGDTVTVDFLPLKSSRIGEMAARFDIVLGLTAQEPHSAGSEE